MVDFLLNIKQGTKVNLTAQPVTGKNITRDGRILHLFNNGAAWFDQYGNAYIAPIQHRVTPGDITTLGWWDAADTSQTNIIQSGGLVSRLADKSGKGNHLEQLSGAIQPATGGNINGLNAIVNDSFKTMSTGVFADGTMQSTAGDYMVFGVYDVDPIGMLSAAGILQLASGFANNWGEHRTAAAGNWRLELYGSVAGIVPGSLSTNFVQNNAAVFCGLYDQTGNTFSAWVDGDKKANGTSFTAPPGEPLLKIFDGLASGREVKGQIGEILIVPANDTATRQLIEGYLAWKWGLFSSLPSDHPYKTAPPVKVTLGGVEYTVPGDALYLTQDGNYIIDSSGDLIYVK